MVLKGYCYLQYTIKGNKYFFEVKTVIKKNNITPNMEQNIWLASAYVNDNEFTYEFSSDNNYVDAQLFSQDIVDEKIIKLRKKHGRSLRIKKT